MQQAAQQFPKRPTTAALKARPNLTIVHSVHPAGCITCMGSGRAFCQPLDGRRRPFTMVCPACGGDGRQVREAV